MRPVRPGWLRRWGRRALLVCFGVVVALLAVEIALRVLGDHSPVYKVADDRLGYRLRAGVEGVYSIEGRSHYRINRDGWRDREHHKAKPPDTLRIAVVGDSFTEAIQVEREETFWWILQERLNAAAATAGDGRQIEVLNFGVAGFGTAQELLVLRHHVREYAPDIVLLAFVSGNDIKNNSRALDRTAHRPYFVYRDDELVIDDSFLTSDAYRMRSGWKAQLFQFCADYSRVAQLINRARSAARIRRVTAEDAGPDRTGLAAATVGQEAGLSDGIYAAPRQPVWREAWRVTEGLLVEMQREALQQGARFAVCLISNGIQVNPDGAVRDAYLKRFGLQRLDYPNRRVAALGQAEGFEVLDLVPPLASHAKAMGRPVHGFGEDLGSGHWNQTGHRVAGVALARWLNSLGWW